MLALLPLKLATTASNNPSSLKSPTATDDGCVPAAVLIGAPKTPPALISTLTLLLFWLATTRSGFASPLKSPAARDTGLVPTLKEFSTPWNPVPATGFTTCATATETLGR